MFEGISRISEVHRAEEGQALVEYALILMLVALVAVAALTVIGTNVDAILDAVGAGLTP
jgi:pilus assembly protein Flp/PilA